MKYFQLFYEHFLPILFISVGFNNILDDIFFGITQVILPNYDINNSLLLF